MPSHFGEGHSLQTHLLCCSQIHYSLVGLASFAHTAIQLAQMILWLTLQCYFSCGDIMDSHAHM